MQFKTKMLPRRIVYGGARGSIFALAGAITFAFAFSLANSAIAQDKIIKIGHVAPITGPIAHLGKDNENGARMAIDELNAKGTLIGGQKVKFELLTEDDAADPKQANAAAQKLVDAGVSGVIGHLNSGTSIPASKIYYDAGIPQISPSTTSPKYTHQGFNTTFRVVANDVQLGGALGRYAATKMHAKTAAIIDDRTAYGQGVAQEFAKSARKAGLKIVSKQYTNDKATDFNAILTAIKGKHPDIIFFGGMDAVAGPMLRQMNQLDINAHFMGGDGICTEQLGPLAGDSMKDGQVVCAEAGGVEGAQEKQMEEFKAAYKKRFGYDVKLYAAYVYDAVMTMVQAMQEAQSSDPAKYLPKLAKIHHQGISGDIAFDKNGDLKDATLTLYTFKKGERTVLEVTH